MRLSFMRVFCFAVLLVAGCATRYHLPCSFQEPCPDGYSCRLDECIADGSLSAGDTCSKNEMCKEGLFCPAAFFQCARPCEKILEPESECAPDQMCVPTLLAGESGGACVPTECKLEDGDQICKDKGGRSAAPNPNNRCIRASRSGSGLCMPACLLGKRVADSAQGVDQCVADLPGRPTHCGRVPTGDLVCVPAGAARLHDACQPFPGGDSVASACRLNIDEATNKVGLPLVCLDADGATAGENRCRLTACNPNMSNECPAGTTCVTKLGITFCG